ncbi:MAG TPA: twin-arginine translocase TatA/TatE family subunit [Opitutaceae bacterium]|jgi:sec-independent protein translocase protein TatA|nr:twin-arginine translocase TatA/TatE family subunit [Opitutaceae bacterium]
MNSPHFQFAGLIPTGGGEWVLILLVVLLLFGGTKLPQLAKGLGQSMKEFKKASKEDDTVAPAKEELKKSDSQGTN